MASVVSNLKAVRAKVAHATATSAWKQQVGSLGMSLRAHHLTCAILWTASSLNYPLVVFSNLLPQCTLVAVSKTKPIEDLRAAYDHDQRHFGENYIQELIQKTTQLPPDVQWHYIGHVQSNKAKALVRDVPNLFVVETVDSIKIANALDAAAKSYRSTRLNVLVQVNTSDEVQKSGVTTLDEAVALAQHIEGACGHLHLAGLMTIGRYGDATSECFERLVACRQRIADALGKENATDLALSMGMSNDYELAIANGSTFVRVGSTIFGERNYTNTER